MGSDGNNWRSEGEKALWEILGKGEKDRLGVYPRSDLWGSGIKGGGVRGLSNPFDNAGKARTR